MLRLSLRLYILYLPLTTTYAMISPTKKKAVEEDEDSDAAPPYVWKPFGVYLS